METYNLIILKFISVVYMYKYLGFIKTFISIISYMAIKCLANIVIKSIKQVHYESTLIGSITTFLCYLNIEYGYIIKRSIYYVYVIPSAILRIFSRYFSSSPIILFGIINLSSGLGLIVTLSTLSLSAVSDLKKLYKYIYNLNEW